MGAELRDGDRVMIVEDVTTSGKSIDETYPIITAAADIEVCGLMVSLNRQEVGRDGQEVAQRYGFATAAIVSMDEVVSELHNREVAGRVVIDDACYERIQDYYAQYGVATD